MQQSSVPPIEGLEPGDGVTRVGACRLVVDASPWAYATERADEIEAHWRRRHAAQPSMFNGVVHVLAGGRCGDDGFSGELLRTDFKSYLHWRDAGFPFAGVRDAFGSALIRSREGHVILGRQRAGNINAGLAYLPGGFIDERDVSPSGSVDIAASILRELVEETGQQPDEFERAQGLILTRCGPLLSFALELRSPLGAEALRERTLSHLATDAAGELADMVIIRTPDEVARARVHPYAALLLTSLLAEA